MKQFLKEVVDILREGSDLTEEEIKGLIETPPDPQLGDYAFSCFVLAKKLRKPPDIIAEGLSRRLKPREYISQIKNAGPYINFTVDRSKFTEAVLREIFTGRDSFGDWEVGSGKTVVVDFSSPNIAKPFGIGHLRSTVIGNSICKLYESLGYKCIRINHLGDWGTQFGKLITAYKRWGEEKCLEEDPVGYLYDLYVRFHAEAQRDGSLEDEAREWFKRLEEGDREATHLWSRFKDISLMEFQRIYDQLEIGFDSYTGESFYNAMIDETIERLRAAGLVRESQGALIVDLEKYGMPPCLLRKKDGSTLYATRDIAAALYRFRTYHFDRMIYVVGADQKLHFQQVFKVLDLMGCNWVENCVHVPFGLIRFGQERMSTRKGNIVLLEDVFRKAVELTVEIMEEKNPALKGKEGIAKDVGIGAIIFADLSSKRMKNVDFEWDKVLNFNGETGPYVQYTHARFSSVLRKYGKEVDGDFDPSVLSEDPAFDVTRNLGRFPDIVKRSADEYEPSLMTNYLLDLCGAANRFYNSCRVLTRDPRITNARILLVYCVRTVLNKGLNLLGIKAPDEM
ncbi:MAG TPA: arginine--tRNA ligase [Candidatus Latescibacteria bacterium]|nr:arginine--tRNA ligase [Candidatus Latescibacterota bacterium]